jgi:hypothetical protein
MMPGAGAETVSIAAGESIAGAGEARAKAIGMN